MSSAPTDESLPASFANWMAHRQGRPALKRFEIPIYSDIEFSLPETKGLGPYRLQRAFPRELTDPAMILFLDEHLDPENRPSMDKTQTAGYTGTGMADEVAALLSLSLGRRFMAGSPTRIQEPSKEGAIIMGDRSRPAFFKPAGGRSFGPPALRIPRATARLEVTVEKLASYGAVQPAAASPLVRAARLYRDALWIAETEPDLAWLLLVSALEVAALQQHLEETLADILRQSKQVLVERLERVDPSLVEEVASHLARELKATARFMKFMKVYLPGPPALRPPADWEWTRLSWEPAQMKKMLDRTYKYRSEALHEGTPFPPRMSQPPFGHAEWPAPSERVLGNSASDGNSVWTEKDLPMSLHTFEYIARGALLNWWTTVITSSALALDAPPAASESITSQA